MSFEHKSQRNIRSTLKDKIVATWGLCNIREYKATEQINIATHVSPANELDAAQIMAAVYNLTDNPNEISQQDIWMTGTSRAEKQYLQHE